jgi:hypothetical protein
MSAHPEVGTVLGEFDAVLDRARVWRVDWAVGLDLPEYQDPEVARALGYPDIPVPPGSLVFFSFLDDGWLELAGIRFDRSLAVRRTVVNHRQLFVGDTVHGRSVIEEVDVRRASAATVVKTLIRTTYAVDDTPGVEESVTYSTRHPEEER